MIPLFYSALLVCLSIGLTVAQNVVCRDEDGTPVDWYYLYKLPKNYTGKAGESGLRYLYLTSSTQQHGWKLSNRKIDDENSLPGQTLTPILMANNTADDTVLVAYNDEPPNGPVSFEGGHTKGVIATDTKTGFWLIHSVPKYPQISTYDYPTTALHYGQSFLCISVSLREIDSVGKQQTFNQPNIYYSRIPEKFRAKLPNLLRAIEKRWPTEPPFYNFVTLTSLDGIEFGSFAKSGEFKKELYADWVGPILNDTLFVETWRHGAGLLPSSCTRWPTILNVAAIHDTNLNLHFHSTMDHSKWCVSSDPGYNWICVGDINRAQHQLKRGGGTVCTQNRNVSNAYANMIGDSEPCSPKTTTPSDKMDL